MRVTNEPVPLNEHELEAHAPRPVTVRVVWQDGRVTYVDGQAWKWTDGHILVQLINTNRVCEKSIWFKPSDVYQQRVEGKVRRR